MAAQEFENWSQMATEVQDQDHSQHDSHRWGWLDPCTEGTPRVDFTDQQYDYSIGRDSKCDVVIRSSTVSGFHCTISYDPTGHHVRIEDHSTNGTFVNNQLVGKNQFLALIGTPKISFGQATSNGATNICYYFQSTNEMANEAPVGGFFNVYQQLHRLGKGGFGTVYKVLDKVTGKYEAVKKIIRSEYYRSTGAFAQFLEREVTIMKELNHGNIVKFINSYEDINTVYIVMELVDGTDLQDRRRAHSWCFSDDLNARNMTFLVSKGLDYIHSRGIAHRDLKPQNILVTVDGTPKIADFGLSKMFDEQTFLKTWCGTPIYRAPEIRLSSSTPYTLMVDSWSMGVIVYDMLTGLNDLHRRFYGNDYHIDDLIEHLSQNAQHWIRTMLQHEPDARMSIKESLDHPWLSERPSAQAVSVTSPTPD
ncbi:kinase-like protein [Clavulina sp. PMI_390]|nr:kinase-like protein [Clavulina sp. PMI_390]